MPSKPKPEWFLAPRDIPPDTTITLGKLLTSPCNPVGPPYLRAVPIVLPVSASASATVSSISDKDSTTTTPNTPIQTPSPIHVTRHAYRSTTSTNQSYKLGVFASFLTNILGVGADVSTDVSHSHTTTVTVDTLETSTFEPTREYLNRLLNDTHNLSELFPPVSSRQKSPFKKLYVVTGVQVARGGSIEQRRKRDYGGDVKVSLDPVALGTGVPGTGLGEVGPTVGASRSRESEETVGKHDFVYAFKINKVAYRKMESSTATTVEVEAGRQERVTRGAAFGYDARRRHGDVEKDEEEGPTAIECQVLGMDERDAGRNEFGVRGEEVLDGQGGDGDGDGEVCIVIDPSTMEEEEEDDDDGSEDDDER